MSHTIVRINAGANCYLIRGRDGHILIDTGAAILQRPLLRGLERAGCQRGDLRLVVLTHADIDHVGNCAYLQREFGARVGMHETEARTIDSGDPHCHRKATPDRLPRLFRALAVLGRPFSSFECFEADIFLADGQDLAPQGIEASILSLPGHSKGSIGVLTNDGDLFCGDLFWSYGRRPRLHPLVDDLPAARESLNRLKSLPLRIVYPGHGRPFSGDRLPQ